MNATAPKTEPAPVAEVAVIGSILSHGDRALIATDAEGLTADHFTDAACRRVFCAAVAMREDGLPVEELAVLASAGITLETATAIIEHAPPSPAFTGEQARLIVSAYRKKTMAGVLAGAQTLAHDPNVTADAVSRYVEEGMARATGDGDKSAGTVDAARWITTDPAPADWLLDGVFETGSRVLIVAPSKCRKSFFALQLGASLAAGVPFLGMAVPHRRRVLLVNMENAADWQHRRGQAMFRTLGLSPESFGNPCRFSVLNGRGTGVDLSAIARLAVRTRPECIILDPLYRLDGGADESDQSARKSLVMELERIGARTGAALVIVHHDPKGKAGDRDTRDRGGGSSIINRDVDCTLALTPWGDAKDADADNLSVLSILARHAPPRPDVSIEFRDGAFHDADRAPVKQTTRTAGRQPEGDANADARTLAKSILDGTARTLTDCRKLSTERFGKRRGERAFDAVFAAPEAVGVTVIATGPRGATWAGTRLAAQNAAQSGKSGAEGVRK